MKGATGMFLSSAFSLAVMIAITEHFEDTRLGPALPALTLLAFVLFNLMVYLRIKRSKPYQEIERKFLVHSGFRKHVSKTIEISQGYLCDDPERTVRVRIQGKKAYLTIKGIGNETGTSRFEFEKRIPLPIARRLLSMCLPGIVEKQRHLVTVSSGHTFEIDEFLGENAGLIIAEIELRTEHEMFLKPSWLLEEVTGQKRYYNSALRKRPFSTWTAEAA